MPVVNPTEIVLSIRPGGVEEVRGLVAEVVRLRPYELTAPLPSMSSLPALSWIERTIGQVRHETRMLSAGRFPAPDPSEQQERKDRAVLRLGVLNREISAVAAPLDEIPACSELVRALRDSDLERARRELMNLRNGVRLEEVKTRLRDLWSGLSVFERISLMGTIEQLEIALRDITVND